MYYYYPHYSLTLPVVSITSQRIVLNLRRFDTSYFTTRDISREIDRQIEALQISTHCTGHNNVVVSEGDHTAMHIEEEWYGRHLLQ